MDLGRGVSVRRAPLEVSHVAATMCTAWLATSSKGAAAAVASAEDVAGSKTNLWSLLGSPHHKDHSVLGSILGPELRGSGFHH